MIAYASGSLDFDHLPGCIDQMRGSSLDLDDAPELIYNKQDKSYLQQEKAAAMRDIARV